MEEGTDTKSSFQKVMTIVILLCAVLNIFLLKHWITDQPSGGVPGMRILYFPFIGIPMLLAWGLTLSGLVSRARHSANILLGISMSIAVIISGLFETSVMTLLLVVTVGLILFKNIELLDEE